MKRNCLDSFVCLSIQVSVDYKSKLIRHHLYQYLMVYHDFRIEDMPHFITYLLITTFQKTEKPG